LTAPAARARFGAYEILHELKSGGMGAVLLARRRGPGAFEQLVAIKTIRPELAATPAVHASFLDEAAILARIHHPGIATVHDFGEEAGTLYMVMEYVAGIPFRELVDHKPPPAVIARAIAEACRGLHAAHEARDLHGGPLGLVHRDISPDNLMLGFDGHVKVIDFGIALVKKNRQAPVTEFGTVKGKPPYMSPEQVANEAIDRRSDIFSLGAVLWELLAHRQLFQGDSIYAIAYAVSQGPIAPPSQALGQPLPIGLDAAVMNALERDAERRTPTAAAFAEELEQVAQQAGGETLAAWVERVLAGPRENHRNWLAGIITDQQLPPVVGRASGQVTELAPLGLAGTQQAPRPAVTPLAPEPPVKTSIGGTELDHLSLPPKNRVAPLVILLLVLLAGGAAVFYIFSRTEAPAVVVRDAAVVPVTPDAAAIDAAAPADASEPDASIPVEVPVDAGRKHPVRADAAIVTRPDAAEPQPTGTGTVDILYKEGVYANISIDGGPAQNGPLVNHKLPAGRHTISFIAPNGDVRDKQNITVEPNKKITVRER